MLADADFKNWKRNWKVIDNEVKEKSDQELIIENAFWPSYSCTRESVEARISELCAIYINEASPKEICSSNIVRENTLRRAKLFSIYGPEVFMEALQDPIKTMKRDVLPRFLASDAYSKMNARLFSCETLPTAESLDAIPPKSSLIDSCRLDDIPLDRLFTLNEIVNCKYLYQEFLVYLRQQVCSENLLCVRMVDIFKEQLEENNTAAAEDEAWTIYRYFVASGAAFEVSISYVSRKQLMRSLAKPAINTFDEIRKSAYNILLAQFNQFKFNDQYLQLASFLRTKKIEKEHAAKRQSKSTFSCLGYI